MWAKMSTKQRQKILLAKSTKQEGGLTEKLSSAGVKFDRQYEVRTPAGRRYYLDFYLPAHALAVEIDGGTHRGREDKDEERDYEVARYCQIKTLRFRSAKDAAKELRRMGVMPKEEG